MKLSEKQFLFMSLLPMLIEKIYDSGYTCTGGDLWAKTGHKENSLHYERLAIDINLFKDGKWLTDTESHRPFGEYWESLNPMCRWGGRFKDGNHYEFTEWRTNGH